ncbi:hypothetical protein [Neobacillus bataviensis]|uniref:hypothetical protein n=1 Tax=Neobacillus bataviensis TaxID=220685 RepID=UPI001CBDC6F8|nr:hypothetical protein [Neobacillus bataviensis]
MTNQFPSPYPTLLGDDPFLQSCLDKAVEQALEEFKSLKPFRTAISFVAINETQHMEFKHAGKDFGKSFFTASLKVGVLYAVFEEGEDRNLGWRNLYRFLATGPYT